MIHLVTVDPFGVVCINGEVVKMGDFHSKALRGGTGYYPPGTNTRPLERLMGPDDTAYSGRNVKSPSFSYKSKRGSFRIAPFASWGVEEKDPKKGLSMIFDKIGQLAELEGGAGKTLASTAGKVGRKLAIEPNEIRQLAPQYRALAHQAIHQGPTVVLRGGCQEGIEVDRVKAFLQGMRAPVPVGWTPLLGATWDLIAELPDPGMVRATVWIEPDRCKGKLPPLPVKTSGGTVYPVGLVQGCWTLDLLRQAVRLWGVEVRELAEVALAACEPIHAPAADYIESLPKGIAKDLYTRYWGRLAAVGGWEGTIRESEGAVRLDGSDLWWRWAGATIGSHQAPDYRPDQAAFIADSNHRAMNEVIAGLPTDALIAAHVDALWIDQTVMGAETYTAPAGFKEKRRGELRFYATGTYDHAGELHAMGCPDDLTGADGPAKMAAWTAGLKLEGNWIRRWHPMGGPCQTDPGALSDPPIHTEDHLLPPGAVPPCGSEAWNDRGWPTDEYSWLNDYSMLEVW